MKIINKNNLLISIGNFLIVGSVLGFGILFYPIIQLYLNPPNIPSNAVSTNEYVVVVPKISAYSPVVTDVDPWKEREYMNALKKGVAQALGTDTPDKKGSTYLFAHSSGNPLESNRYNTVFYRLGELVKGDSIYLKYKGDEYRFVVYEKKVVWPSEVKYLKESIKGDSKGLVLQTCTPIGTSIQRLLVFARRVN